MPIKINGSTSGSVTLAAPATGSDVTVTLPAAAGTVALTASPTLSSPTLTGTVTWAAATLNASQAEVLTGQTTTSTSYTDLATSGPAVTLTTGTKALVIISCYVSNNTSSKTSLASFAVSGATTVAASDNYAIGIYAGSVANIEPRASRAYLVTGLTAGSNTFTMKYRAPDGSSTASFGHRQILVIDMGS